MTETDETGRTKETFLIKSEANAWELLNAFGTKKAVPAGVNVIFEGFPSVSLKFDGEKYGEHKATINIRTMRALEAIQKDLERMYALAAYNDESRQLTDEERAALEINFQIKEGSAIAETLQLADSFNKFLLEAAKKMGPEHFIILALIGAVGWTGYKIFAKHIEAKKATRLAEIQAEERNSRDAEETKRLEILAQIVRQSPAVETAIHQRNHTVAKIAKSVRGAERVELPGELTITEQVAKELFPRNTPRKGEEVTFIESFKITGVFQESNGIFFDLVSEDASVNAAQFKSTPADFTKLCEAIRSGESIRLDMAGKDFEGERKGLMINRISTPEATDGSEPST